MDSYKVVMTDDAMSMLNDIVDYINYELLNDIAADNVYADALKTVDKLEDLAGSLNHCTNETLAKLGYRKIHFLKHSYVFIYKIYDDTAVIEGTYHDSQDYENRFERELTRRNS